jgi:hypothetical protein
MSEVLSELSDGYYLERDPDVVVLRRIDGSLVAAFSSRGAAPEAVRRAAEEAGHGEAFAVSREAPLAVSSAEPRLRANFFGRFELLRAGEVVSLGRSARALRPKVSVGPKTPSRTAGLPHGLVVAGI